VVIENLVYARPGEDLRGQAREGRHHRVGPALDDLDIDLLTLEYPGSPEGCRRLAAILHRPWAFCPRRAVRPLHRHHQDRRRGRRRLWLHRRPARCGAKWWAWPDRAREEFLTTVALPRLERLIEVAEHRARPWIEATRR